MIFIIRSFINYWHRITITTGAVPQIRRSLVRSHLVSLEFFIDIKSFRSHYGPGVDSASNRNEYQEHFLGGKGGRCVRLTTLQPSCAVVTKSGNLNFLEPSGPLQACNGTAVPVTITTTTEPNTAQTKQVNLRYAEQIHFECLCIYFSDFFKYAPTALTVRCWNCIEY